MQFQGGGEWLKQKVRHSAVPRGRGVAKAKGKA